MTAAAPGFDPTAAPPPTPVAKMFATLVGVGLACGLLIVSVFELTAPVIRENRIAARARAVLDVVPGAARSRPFRYVGSSGFEPAAVDADGADLVFAGFTADGALAGVAVPAAAMGYQDVVRILYGYAPDQEAVVGMQVLESRETPGLGDRVETDPDYLQNFAALDVALAEGGERLAHPVEVVKPGDKQHDWQIDTISGATITSATVAGMIRDSAAVWVPRIAAHRGDFRPAAAGERAAAEEDSR